MADLAIAVVWAALAMATLGSCSPESLPEVHEPPSVDAAVARGDRAPERERLLQVAVAYLVENADVRPTRVCVGVLCRGNTPKCLVVDIDLARLQAKFGLRPEFVAMRACEGSAFPDAWLVQVSEVQRWWDTPDEYEVLGQLWRPFVVETKPRVILSDSVEDFRLVASYRGGNWQILRRVIHPHGQEAAVEQGDEADER